MAENDIREKIEDKMVPVLSTEEHVFRMNSKINVKDQIFTENDDHVKEVVDSYEKKIKALKEKLELMIEIKDELINLCENKYEGCLKNLNDINCKETKQNDTEENYLNPSEYPVEYSSYADKSLKTSNITFKSIKSSFI